MNDKLPTLIFLCGIGQAGVLTASALVPSQLNWRNELASLSRLHRQMYWTYGGYVVLSIIAFSLMSLFNSQQLADGSGLSRAICLYIALFWGIRVSLQGVFDVKPHLTAWWLKLGYHGLTAIFICLALIYGYAAIMT